MAPPTPTQAPCAHQAHCHGVSGPAVTTPSAGATALRQAQSFKSASAVFASHCNVCHPSGSRGVGPEIKGKSSDFVRTTVRSGRHSMPPFGSDKISDAELHALVAYVASLK